MEDFKTITEDVKKYVELRTDLIKLEAIEKSSKIIASVLFYIIFVVIIICLLFFLSLTLIFALKDVVGGLVYSLLLVSGIFAIAALILFFLLKKIFVNTFVKVFSKIMFDDDEQN